MYTFNSRIRYSEVDSEGRLTLASLLNYFQDASTFQSEDLGLGLQYMKEKHMTWVLSSWQIVVERYPDLCEEVEIGTLPYEFKLFMGSRNFCMRDKEGCCIAKANSLWTLLNMDTQRFVMPTEEMLEKYKLEPKLDMEYAPRKVAVPGGGYELEPIVVKQHHLDTNHHVNNGQYVDIVLGILPQEFFPKEGIHQLRVEYKKQAFLDDVFYPYVVRQEDRAAVSLRDDKGEPYVNVELS